MSAMKQKELVLLLAFSLSVLFLFACGGGQKPAESTETKPAEAGESAGPVTKIDPATAATITGKVSFEGEAPKPRQIRMDAEASCAALHKEPVFAEEIVVNDKSYGTLYQRRSTEWRLSLLRDARYSWQMMTMK